MKKQTKSGKDDASSVVPHKFKIGDIVWINYPYEDILKAAPRPGLIVKLIIVNDAPAYLIMKCSATKNNNFGIRYLIPENGTTPGTPRETEICIEKVRFFLETEIMDRSYFVLSEACLKDVLELEKTVSSISIALNEV
jgi:hypothetical protein